ncbi:origin recognition complex subunit 3 [Marchantia polymorpha subsp. ruderalis]
MDSGDDGDFDENQLQACFVLHRNREKSTGKVCPRRKSAKKGKNSESEKSGDVAGLYPIVEDPASYGALRLQAFKAVWGRIQKLIEDIVEGENHEIFSAIQQWICNRQFSDAQMTVYHTARLLSNGVDGTGLESSWAKPSASCGKQLNTALVFLGGVNPSDHRRTFDGLTGHLNVNKCHVARLTSIDFLSKAGLGGPLRSLFRQLIHIIPETTDMEILAAWHREVENQGLPIAIVVEDCESCDPKVLAEFFVLLSEWIRDLPIVLILGMATSDDAIRKLLPASALARLHLWRFSLKAPQKLLETITRAVLIESFCAFDLSPEVILFLYGYFESHDLTVTSIIRSLKITCAEHFWREPLSFLCGELLVLNSKADLEEKCSALPDMFLHHATQFSSVKGKLLLQEDEPVSKHMAASLWDTRSHKKMWKMVFQCISTLAKYGGISFGDLFCGVLQWLADSSPLSNSDQTLGPLEKLISKFRDMSGTSLRSTLEEWRKITLHEKELNAEVSQILTDFISSSTVSEVNQASNQPVNLRKSPSNEVEGVQVGVSQQIKHGVISRSALRRLGQQQCPGVSQTGLVSSNKKAEDLLRRLVREHLKPADSRPFHEIYCFRDVNSLKEALIGDTRRRVHMDLLNSHNVLKCECCPTDGELSSSLHDTTLAYILSQEYGDLVRIHNWYQSFAAICDPKLQGSVKVQEENSPPARRGRPRKSFDLGSEEEGSAKKRRGRPRKSMDAAMEEESEEKKRPRLSDAVAEENAPIQARFTRAATELQIVGLLQMPKKGNSDTVRRLCI